MKHKQIYAALDIGSYDIKLVVGEFHNTRFNVIRVETIRTNGVYQHKIEDAAAVTQAISEAVSHVSELLQVRIERVLLSIPAVSMKRVSQRISVSVQASDKRIQTQDIQEAIYRAQQVDVGRDVVIVNVVPVKYIVNGISSRRLPLNEVSDSLAVDVDLLCADRKTVFDYVRVTEHAGLEILDIFLQPYAEAKEIAIFEQTMEHYIIYMNIGHQCTSLSLFAHGRLASSEMFPIGMEHVNKALADTFGFSQETADRLKQYSTHLEGAKESAYPMYMWTKNNRSYALKEEDVAAVIINVVKPWLVQIKDIAKELFETKDTKLIFGGGGGELLDLPRIAKDIWRVDVQAYVPETLGARSASLITNLGMFYAYKDACEYTLSQQNSIDSVKFVQALTPKRQEEEEGFTGRLKGLLFSETKERNKE